MHVPINQNPSEATSSRPCLASEILRLKSSEDRAVKTAVSSCMNPNEQYWVDEANSVALNDIDRIGPSTASVGGIGFGSVLISDQHVRYRKMVCWLGLNLPYPLTTLHKSSIGFRLSAFIAVPPYDKENKLPSKEACDWAGYCRYFHIPSCPGPSGVILACRCVAPFISNLLLCYILMLTSLERYG